MPRPPHSSLLDNAKKCWVSRTDSYLQIFDVWRVGIFPVYFITEFQMFMSSVPTAIVNEPKNKVKPGPARLFWLCSWPIFTLIKSVQFSDTYYCTSLHDPVLCVQNVARNWSQWPRGLRCGPAAARWLGLWVRIPRRAWMSVSCKCCMLSDRGLCDGPIIRP